MSSWHPKQCRRCGKGRDESHISKRGFCVTCSETAAIEANRQISAQCGPVFDRTVQAWLTSKGKYGRPTTPYPPDA